MSLSSEHVYSSGAVQTGVQFAISSSRDTIRRPIRYDIIRVFTATGRSAADMQMGSMMTVYAMRSMFSYLYLDHRAISAYTLRSRVSFSLAGRRGGHSAIYWSATQCTVQSAHVISGTWSLLVAPRRDVRTTDVTDICCQRMRTRIRKSIPATSSTSLMPDRVAATIHRMKWRHGIYGTIRSPFCGYNMT